MTINSNYFSNDKPVLQGPTRIPGTIDQQSGQHEYKTSFAQRNESKLGRSTKYQERSYTQALMRKEITNSTCKKSETK